MSVVNLEPSASSFAHAIVAQSRLGYGVTPFVGSGLSAASGILMGTEFTEYLAYTLYQVIADDADRETPRWDLHRFGWPKSPSVNDVNKTKRWFKAKYKESCKRFGLGVEFDNHGHVKRFEPLVRSSTDWHDLTQLAISIGRPLIPSILRGSSLWDADQQLKSFLKLWGVDDFKFQNSNYSPDSIEQITENGLRASHEWRSTLHFLSKLRISGKRITISDSDSAVIDAFNAHITRDKQPNLGHKMLAHLARSLRSRVVLTTNFDNLLEESFRNILHDINVVPVSIRGNLPDPKTIRAKDCIVKMHGSLLETRADFSLDDIPDEQDLKYFARYLGAFDRRQGDQQSVVNHLLVLGYSGADQRCIQFIKHALELIPELQLFWVCFSERDHENLKRLFQEKAFSQRIHAVISPRPDLLLYQLYQKLNYSLPSGGFSYQFTARVPPHRDGAERQAISDRVSNVIQQFEAVENVSLQVVVEREGDELSRDDRTALLRKVLLRKLSETITSGVVDRELNQTLATKYSRYFDIRMAESIDIPRDSQSNEPVATEKKPPKIIVVQHRSGSIDVARQVTEDLEVSHRKRVVWVEQQDFADVVSLMQDMLTTIAIRVGIFQLEHVCQLPFLESDYLATFCDHFKSSPKNPIDPKCLEEYVKLERHLERFAEHLSLRPSEWVFMVYGRSSAGACASWGGDQFLWSEQEFKVQWSFFQCLTKLGFQVVYFPFDEARRTAERFKFGVVTDETDQLVRQYKSISKPSKSDRAKGLSFPLPKSTKLDQEFLTGTRNNWADANKPSDSRYAEIIRNVSNHWIRPWCDDPVILNARKSTTRQHEAYLRFSFLYALTLFRQSRHVSSFYIDGVFKCPFRFNFTGLDNDAYRALKVTQWISELRNDGVFYEKAGGFSWMHRDIRAGLQHICERINLYDVISQNNVDREYGIKSFVTNYRTGIHSSIGDWYFKAFLTNGHWLPAIESIYHYMMAARHAHMAYPQRRADHKPIRNKELLRYRLSAFTTSLNEMCKAIKLSHSFIGFWLGNANGFSMFPRMTTAVGGDQPILASPQFAEMLDQSIEELNQQGGGLSRKENDRVQLLKANCIQMVGMVGNEVSEGRENKSQRFVFHSNQPFTGNSSGSAQNLTNLCRQLPKETIEGDAWYETWIDMFDNEGADFISTAIDSALKVKHTKTLNSYKLNSIEEKVSRRRAIWAGNQTDPYRIPFILEALGEFIYLWVRRTKRDYHELDAKKHHDFTDSIPRPLRANYFRNPEAKKNWNACVGPVRAGWLVVSLLCNCGLSLCKFIDPMFLDIEIHLRSKFNTFYGLALANLDRYFEAHRHLTEAFAYLTKSAKGLDPVDLSIIRLRRSEAYLTESLRIADFSVELEKLEDLESSYPADDKSHGLHTVGQLKKFDNFACGEIPDTFFRKLQFYRPNCRTDSKTAKNQLTVGFFGPPSFYCSIPSRVLDIIRMKIEGASTQDFRRMLAFAELASLDDAAAALDQAERNLSGRSQDNLWWGRVYAIRLRLFSAEANLNRRTGDNLRGLVKRRPVQHEAVHFDIYQRGILSTAGSPYRQLRIIDYFLDCLIASNENDYDVDSHKLLRALDDFNSIRSNLNEVPNYRKFVKRKLDFLKKSVGIT